MSEELEEEKITRKAKFHLTVTTFQLPKEDLETLDELVGRGVYPSRSEAIRVAIRDLLKKEGFFKT